MDKRIELFLLPLIFVIISLSFFWKAFVYGYVPIPADTIVGLYHPYRDYYARDYPNGIPYENFLITDPVRQQFVWRKLGIGMMEAGVFPLWNPYQNAGTPLLANLQSALLYPLNIIFSLMPFTQAWTLLVILQPVIAGLGMLGYLGMLRLKREARVVGSIVYAFSGFSISWLTWNTIGHVAAWLPFILLIKEHVLHDFIHHAFTRKTWAMLVSLIFVESAYWLAGHIQTALYAWIITDIYLIARAWQIMKGLPPRDRKKYLYRLGNFFGLATTVVFIAVSVQAYTFVQYVLYSSRSVDQQGWQNEDGWFIPWKHLVQFVAPDFFGNPATLNYWGAWNYAELVGYVGIVPLILALTALFFRRDKKTLFFGVLGIGSLLCALPTIIAQLPYLLYIPFVSTAQPTRLLFVVDFSLAVLAALGTDMVVRRLVHLKKILWPIGITGLILAGLWILTLTGNIGPEHVSVSQRNLILPTGLFVGGSVIISLIGRIRQIKNRTIVVCLLVGLVCFDLFRFGWKFTPFTDAAYLYPETQALSFLKQQQGVFRIMSTDDRLLPPNFSTFHELEDIAGYDPLYSFRYGQFVSAWMRGGPDISPFSFNRIINPQQYNTRFTDLLNVKYILSLTPLESEKLHLVFQEGQTHIYENTRVFNRAFLVPDVVAVPDDQYEIEMLFDPSVDLRKTATTQESLSVSPIPLFEDETVIVETYRPHELFIHTSTRYPRLLVVTNVYYPHWKATVDSMRASVHRVNFTFTGISVPAGDHVVRLYTSL